MSSGTAFQAYCRRAEQLWASADQLELERRGRLRERKQLLDAMTWQDKAGRGIAATRLDVLQRALEDSRLQLRQARRLALRAAERATALQWAVRLGQAYTMYRKDCQEVVELTVEFLRPTQGTPGQFLCLAAASGATYMLVLGRDEVEFVSSQPANVVSLAALRSALRPA